MPVHKFRHPDEMRTARWLPVGDPRFTRRLAYLFDLARSFVRVHRLPGVHRYRSIEEANAARAALRRELLTTPRED